MAGYIGVPLEDDPEVLIADALDQLAANVDQFEAREAHLEVWLIEVCGRMNAETRNVARKVFDDIFRYYGESIVGVLPINAVAATALTTWTMIDDAGYTIDAGTLVGYRTSGDTIVVFETVADTVVAPGDTVALEVAIRALDAGVAGNNLGPGGLELIDSLAFVDSVVADAPSSGGVDAETPTEYLGRLRDEMTLLSPRFVLAADAAVLARRVAGVYRALGIDNYEPSEVIATAGRTNASPIITGPAGSYVAEDVGRTATGAGIPGGTTVLSYQSPTQITLSANATSTAASFALTLGSRTNREKMVTVAVVDEDGAALSQAVKDAVAAYLESMREVNFIVHVIDPSYTNIAVDFTVVAAAGYDLADLGARCIAAVQAYLAPGTWGGSADSREWNGENTVRYLEVAQVLNMVDGVRYVQNLTINGGVVDVPLAGVAPLPTVGAVTGVAVAA